MRQYAVYRNRHPDTRRAYPYLLNVQSDLIAETGTRVVVPLSPVSSRAGSTPIGTLMPRVEVAGKPHVLMVPLLAAAETSHLGSLEADLSDQHHTIMAALDMLFTGI